MIRQLYVTFVMLFICFFFFFQNTQIIHHINLDFEVTPDLLCAVKSLMYRGIAETYLPSFERVSSMVKGLELDDVELLQTCNGNKVHTIKWEAHTKRLIQSFQFMCTHSLCTDVSLLVDGKLVKAHKLILCACSPVLRDVFQDNSKINIIHMPEVGLLNVQSLIAYMYFGITSVKDTLMPIFYELCSSLEVESLRTSLDHFVQQKPASNSEEADFLKLKGQINSSLEGVWSRLHQLYNKNKRTDLTFLVEKKKITAHKALLSVACPLIHKLLAQEPSCEHSLILMLNMNYKSIKGVVDIIYKGSCTLADKFRVIVCSHFDRSAFKIRPSQDVSQKNMGSSHLIERGKSNPQIKIVLKPKSKTASQSNSSVNSSSKKGTTTCDLPNRTTNCASRSSKCHKMQFDKNVNEVVRSAELQSEEGHSSANHVSKIRLFNIGDMLVS